MVLLKLLFFTGLLLLLLFFLCRYRTPPPTLPLPRFVMRETSDTSEKPQRQEERGEDSVLALLSPGEGVGAEFTLIAGGVASLLAFCLPKSLRPAWAGETG